MKVLLKLSLLIITISLFFAPLTLAEDGDDFMVNSIVEYKIQESGETQINHHISIENLTEKIHSRKYRLYLYEIAPVDIEVKENGENQPFVIKEMDGGTIIEINFNDSVLGKGHTRIFDVAYKEQTLATKTGEVWEITVPRLYDKGSFEKYSVILEIPESFGIDAYMTPNPEKIEAESTRKFYFDKENMLDSGVNAGFGKFQVFDFDLTYHVENPRNSRQRIEVAIPPDTSGQKISYSEILPNPEEIMIDKDGNWLAVFTLGSKERVDISVKGEVQIFGFLRPFSEPEEDTLKRNLESTEYWQVDNPKIKQIASELETPREIYDYVVNTLSYDYSRVTENNQRLGALAALDNPEHAICMEFTDLFITLARASGIPAREVNGFAYTENPEIQPLSLVSDVLHAWPEYWDDKNKVWVPIDPTWADTTKGVNYFDNLDLRHFAFVIHGENSTIPYPPGSYKLGDDPQKDIFVTFGNLDTTENNPIEIKAPKQNVFKVLTGKIDLAFYNPGPRAIYSLKPIIIFDSKDVAKVEIAVLPPYTEITKSIDIPVGIFAKNIPNLLEVKVSSKTLEIPTFKNAIVSVHMILLGVLLIIPALVLIFEGDMFKHKLQTRNIRKNIK